MHRGGRSGFLTVILLNRMLIGDPPILDWTPAYCNGLVAWRGRIYSGGDLKMH